MQILKTISFLLLLSLSLSAKAQFAYQPQIKAFVDKACLQCHGAIGIVPDLSNYQAVIRYVSKGDPVGSPLLKVATSSHAGVIISASDKDMLYNWIKAGAPEFPILPPATTTTSTTMPNLLVTEIFKISFNPITTKGKIWAEIDGQVVLTAYLDGVNAALMKIQAPFGKTVIWKNSISSNMGLTTLMDGRGELQIGGIFGHYITFEGLPNKVQYMQTKVQNLILSYVDTVNYLKTVTSQNEQYLKDGAGLYVAGPSYSSNQPPVKTNLRGAQYLNVSVSGLEATGGTSMTLQRLDASGSLTTVMSGSCAPANANSLLPRCALSGLLDDYFLQKGYALKIFELPRGKYRLTILTEDGRNPSADLWIVYPGTAIPATSVPPEPPQPPQPQPKSTPMPTPAPSATLNSTSAY